MPQIFMIIDSTMSFTPIEDRISFNLIMELVNAVEKYFGIEGKKEVAFTAVSAVKTFNEAPIQLEVRYAAGKDELNTEQIFDPDEKTQQDLALALKEILNNHFRSFGNSVWVKPSHNSFFSDVNK